MYGISCDTHEPFLLHISLLRITLLLVRLLSPNRSGAWRARCFDFSHRADTAAQGSARFELRTEVERLQRKRHQSGLMSSFCLADQPAALCQPCEDVLGALMASNEFKYLFFKPHVWWSTVTITWVSLKREVRQVENLGYVTLHWSRQCENRGNAGLLDCNVYREYNLLLK